jgi:AcrR family transcriptional regulator
VGTIVPTQCYGPVVERRRQILDAASEAFYEKGFHGVGVDELGRRAGLRGPTLYRSFAGKDEILATLLNEALDELLGAILPVLPDPQLDLERALRHHLRFAVDNRHLVSLYQRDVQAIVEPWKSPFDARRERYTRGWESLVAAAHPGQPPALVAAATQACLGMVFSVAQWPRRAREAVDVPDLVLRLLTSGLESLRTGGGPVR